MAAIVPSTRAHAACLTSIAAILTLLSPHSAGATFIPVCPDPPNSVHLQGKWTCTFDLGGRAVHMMVLRGNGGSHSQVLWWPDHNDGDDARIWALTPGDTTVDSGEITNLTSLENLLCSGHSILPDGRPFITGGTDFGNDFGIPEVSILDHQAGEWESPHPDLMEFPRWYPTNTTLGDGRVFISAGQTHDDLFVFGGHDGSTFLGSPATLAPNSTPEWQTPDISGGTPPAARFHHAMADLWADPFPGMSNCYEDPNRYLAILHGGQAGGLPLSELWGLRWSLRTGEYQWDALSNVSGGPGGRWGHTAVHDPFQKSVLVFGGKGTGGVLNSLHKLSNLNSAADCTSPALAWSQLTPALNPPARYLHAATYETVRRRTFIFGGRNDANPPVYFNDVWAYRDSAGTMVWSKLPLAAGSEGPPTGRAGAAAVFDTTYFHGVRNNRLIVIGGHHGDGTETLSTDVAWLGNIIETTDPPSIKWKQLIKIWTACDMIEVSPGVFEPNPDSLGINQTTIEPMTGARAVLQSDAYARVFVYGGKTSAGVTDNTKILSLGTFVCQPGYFVWADAGDIGTAGSRIGHSIVLDHRNRTALLPEIFDPHAANPATSISIPSVTNPSRWLYSYPFVHLLPTGQLIYSGPDDATALFDFEDGWSTELTDIGLLGDTGVITIFGDTVRVMKCGQKPNDPSPEQQQRVTTIDFVGSTAGNWTERQAMAEASQDANLTILPDGTVLKTGGVARTFPSDQSGGNREPQLWDPESRLWDVHLEETPGLRLAEEPVFRDYHSVAVLLPDGTVFSAGGEDEDLDAVRRNTGAIYMPHYLFNSGGGLATRPEIACVDTNLTYDQTFVVRMTGTNAIANVSLVRPSSVTHGVNMEQRLLMLTIEASSIAGGQRVLTLRTPANGNWAPPGDYMLFALNDQGVPSVAAWVRLAPGGVWSGTLPSNEVTWKGGEVHHISASLTVGDNQSLIVEPGAVVTVAPGAYLRVNEGELEADGATFIGQACGNRWTGLEVIHGSIAMANCLVRGAEYGLTFKLGSGGGAITNTRFSDLGSRGVQVTHTAEVTLEAVTVECPPGKTGFVGILVSANARGPTLIRGCDVHGPDNPGTPTGSGNKGIKISAPAILRGGQVWNLRGSNTRGIEFELRAADTSVTVVLEKDPAGSYPHIFNCSTGIYFGSWSRPVIRDVRIDSTNYAFWVGSVAQPDIGLSETNEGDSDISRSLIKHVRTNTRLSSTPNVQALYNYWGTTSSEAISAKMDGPVDWFPFLSDDPIDPLSRTPAVSAGRVEAQRLQIIGALPNPARNSIEIRYTVPDGSDNAEIEVFSVLGRLVRTGTLVPRATGSWVWDGADDQGRRVPSGIYYVTLRRGVERARPLKIVLLR